MGSEMCIRDSLITPHLHAASLAFTRYDGSMRPDAREAALSSLRHDPHTRILLCSLKCGSLGLNLTAASRVVILEPFWNPFVEEQAIDRVHRLNQTEDVRVYRLTVADTVEGRILELQDKKRELAAAAIEGGKAVARLDVRDLVGLFGADPDAFFARQGRGGGDSAAAGPAGVRGQGQSQGQSRGGAFPGASLVVRERGTVAVSSSSSSSATAADRNRQAEKKQRPRVSNEDPVYGRR